MVGCPLKKALFIVILIALIACVALIQRHNLKELRLWGVYEDALYLPSPEYVKVAALGYDMILADLLWMRSIQAFGGHFREVAKEHKILWNYFDVVTELDPKFIDVYKFGNLALGEGAGRPDLGLKLLEKGMENNPGKYRLPFEAGYVSWWDMGDAKAAKKYYLLAAQCSDVPDWIERHIGYFDLQMGEYYSAFERAIESYLTAMDDNQDYLIGLAHSRIKSVITKWNLNILSKPATQYLDEHIKPADDIQQLLPYILKNTGEDEKFADYFHFLTVAEKYYLKYPKNINNLDAILRESLLKLDRIPRPPEGTRYIIAKFDNIVISDKKLFEFYDTVLGRFRTHINAYKEEHGRYPSLLTDGLPPNAGLPPEPMDGEWLYDSETGEMKSSVYPQL